MTRLALAVLLLALPGVAACGDEPSTPAASTATLVARDEVALLVAKDEGDLPVVAQHCLDEDSFALELGGAGRARYRVRSNFTGESLGLYGRWSRPSDGVIEIVFDWKQLDWPRDDNPSEAGEVEITYSSGAAFPLSPPLRVVLKQQGEVFVTASSAPWSRNWSWSIKRRVPQSEADQDNHYFKRSEFRALSGKSRDWPLGER